MQSQRYKTGPDLRELFLQVLAFNQNRIQIHDPGFRLPAQLHLRPLCLPLLTERLPRVLLPLSEPRPCRQSVFALFSRAAAAAAEAAAFCVIYRFLRVAKNKTAPASTRRRCRRRSRQQATGNKRLRG